MLAKIPVIGLVSGQSGAVNAGLLPCADTYRLAVLHIADGVRLGILESYERDDEILDGRLGQLLLFGHDVFEHSGIDPEIVSALLEGDAEHLLALDGLGPVGEVDVHDVVVALLLGLEDLQGLGLVAGGDDAVAHLMLDDLGGGHVAHIRQSDPVAEAAHPVSAAGPGIGAGQGAQLHIRGNVVHLAQHIVQGQAQGGAGGGDMLEGSGGADAGGLFQFPHQLDAVESVQEVDIAGLAVQHGHGQVAAVRHKDPGRLLVGVAAIFQCQFVHIPIPFLSERGLTSSFSCRAQRCIYSGSRPRNRRWPGRWPAQTG